MPSSSRPIDQFLKLLRAARRVSTPLLAIRSADPALAIARVQETVGKCAPVVQWDIVRGLIPCNECGAKQLSKLVGERDPSGIGPVETLVLAAQLSEDSVLLYANAQRFWADAQVLQGIWNLRDVFKENVLDRFPFGTGVTQGQVKQLEGRLFAWCRSSFAPRPENRKRALPDPSFPSKASQSPDTCRPIWP